VDCRRFQFISRCTYAADFVLLLAVKNDVCSLFVLVNGRRRGGPSTMQTPCFSVYLNIADRPVGASDSRPLNLVYHNRAVQIYALLVDYCAFCPVLFSVR